MDISRPISPTTGTGVTIEDSSAETQGNEPPPSLPPTARKTRNRKRAASAIDGQSPTTPSSSAHPDEPGRNLTCLCTPPPKIPRPSNSFILYRKYFQEELKERHGIPNPDISRILGRRWQEESEEVKREWKEKAEQVKIFHQLQYPGYKYQPNRKDKKDRGSEPCLHCGGRPRATPRTPSTPVSAGEGPAMPIAASRTVENEPDQRQVQGAGPLGFKRQSLQYSEGHEPTSPDPDPKRQRATTTGSYQPTQASTAHIDHTASHHGLHPLPNEPSLPSLVYRQRVGGQGAMGPPSGSQPVYYAPPPRASTFNTSLRLPPLQTQSPPMAEDSARYVSPPNVAMSGGTESQVGIEAMVMSIPYLNKIETLCRISPALQVPRLGSPHTETRGALIAIEGPRPEMLRVVARAVERMLSGSEDIVLKRWGDDGLAPLAEGAGMENRGESWRSNTHAEASRYSMSYFGRMVRWHERSNEIIRHITTQPGPAPDDATAGGRSRSATWLTETLASTSETRIPVALVTTGFSLTWSDKFACAMPIADSYAPVDHWTWVSTFWRGIVGPDLFIYVEPSSEEDIRKFGDIEVKSNGIMVVRIDERREMDVMTERRLAFETVEWVRGGTYKTSF